MDAIANSDLLELVVLAAGTHGSQSFGGEERRLGEKYGDCVLSVGPAIEIGRGHESIGAAFGAISSSMTDLLEEITLDLLLVLGDRWELLAATGAALLTGVHIAHLHGGEVTHGAIDDRIRHSITKIADLHLCATERSARRIRQLGEESARIFVTGAPGLDRARATTAPSDDELANRLGHPVVRPLGVIVYHPPTLDQSSLVAEAEAVFNSASQLGTAVVLYPGADPGSREVIRIIGEVETNLHNVHVQRNLGLDYLPLLASSDVLIGNSSSGIIEAASFGVPVVNVGGRQGGRERATNVIDVTDPSDVVEALRRALSEEFKGVAAASENPYGDGRSGPRIARILAEFDLERSRTKSFPDGLDTADHAPCLITREACIRDAIAAIDGSTMGIALVVDDKVLVGTVTDGDVRRALLRGDTLGGSVKKVMNRTPLTVREDTTTEDVVALMMAQSVTQVPVVDHEGRVVGLHRLQGAVNQLL